MSQSIYPEWITKEYFKGVLEKDEPHCVAVTNCRPVAALPDGENYASTMLRIHLDLEMQDGSAKHKTYILKVMLDDDKGGSAIKELSLFPKEMKMYQTYLPAYEGMYAAAGCNVQLAPKCLLVENFNDGMNFVFEDLESRNFKNVSRVYGMDMPHMVRTMRKLAEFHAASVVYEEQHGPYPKDFHKGFVNGDGNDDFQRTLFHTKVNSFKKAISTWGLDEADKYIEKFPTYEQYDRCARSVLDTKDNFFNVLTHGDFWSSNVMQNYLDSGDIDELLILDYQFCKWGSPAEDLLFFISISAAQDIRIREYEHFVEIYHTHLIKCLKTLNYSKKLPKLRELQMEMYREQPGFYAFFAVFSHMPIILSPSGSKMEMTLREDEEADAVRFTKFTEPIFVNAMKELFPFYHRRGLFNFEDYD